MEKEFIPYKEALALKELGFNELCFGWFDNLKVFNVGWNIDNSETELKAPLYQQVFRWFREKYNLECYIKSLYEQRENKGFYFGIDDYFNRDFYSKPYYSYEEAELACLGKLIEITKEKLKIK